MTSETHIEIARIALFSGDRKESKLLSDELTTLRPAWQIITRPQLKDFDWTHIQSEIDCLLVKADSEKKALSLLEAITGHKKAELPPVIVVTSLSKKQKVREAVNFFNLSRLYVLLDDSDTIISALESIMRAYRVEQKLRQVNTLLSNLIEERSKTLHEFSERIRFLTEFSSDAVFEIEKDRTTGISTFISANRTACSWLGYSQEELLQLPFSHFLEPAAITNITQLLNTISQPQEFSLELSLKNRNQERLFLNIVIRAFESDRGLRMIAIAHKILSPEFSLSEHASESDYEQVVSHIGQLMYIGNVDTQQMKWSGAASQITGYTIKHLNKGSMREWRKRIVSEDYPRTIAAINKAILRISSYEVEYGFLHKNGEIRYLEDRGVVLPDHRGAPHRIMGTIKDITEKKMEEEARQRLEKELQHTQRLESLGVLAGGIAHDFNNILAGIIGLTDLALREIPSDSFAFEDLNEVLHAAHRAKELVQQILAFSRQGDHERSLIFPHIIAREVIRLLCASLPPAIEIIDSIDIQSGAVMANASQLHQVITNFSTNAAQSIKGGSGKVEIQVCDVEVENSFSAKNPNLPPGSYVRIAVSDTGHGMTPSILARVFDPFFTTKGPGEGTGMGLAVAHGIITDHGGVILAQSRLKKGSTFEAYLPKITDPQITESLVQSGPADGRNNTHILFVDDDETVLRFASSALPRLGFKITLCKNAEEALHAFAENTDTFDLVITDQRMPGMSGTELAAAIRKSSPRMPVILFTGFSKTLTEKDQKITGIQTVLRKPIIVRDLLTAIRKTLKSPTDL